MWKGSPLLFIGQVCVAVVVTVASHDLNLFEGKKIYTERQID